MLWMILSVNIFEVKRVMSNLLIAAAAAGVAFMVYEFTKKDDSKTDKDEDTDSGTNNGSTTQNGSTNPPAPAPVIELPKTEGAMRCADGPNAGLYWVPRAPYPWGGSGPSLLSDQDMHADNGKPDEVVTYPGQEKKFYWRQGAEDCTGA